MTGEDQQDRVVEVHPFSRADYVHPEETMQLRHLAADVAYRLLVKDADGEEADEPQWRIGITVPLDKISDLLLDS